MMKARLRQKANFGMRVITGGVVFIRQIESASICVICVICVVCVVCVICVICGYNSFSFGMASNNLRRPWLHRHRVSGFAIAPGAIALGRQGYRASFSRRPGAMGLPRWPPRQSHQQAAGGGGRRARPRRFHLPGRPAARWR